MVRIVRWLAVMLAAWICWAGWGWQDATVRAADLARQRPIAVRVELGSLENNLHFYPDTLHFKAGKLYRLTLVNPSPVKHYFTAKDFAAVVWTSKVEVAGVEIKGQVSELELKPDAEVDWLFVPQKAGVYNLKCIIPGHAESGMVGTLTVEAN